MRHQGIRTEAESVYSQRCQRGCFAGAGYGQTALGKAQE